MYLVELLPNMAILLLRTYYICEKTGKIWSKMAIYDLLVNRISYCTSRLYNKTLDFIWQLRSLALT